MLKKKINLRWIKYERYKYVIIVVLYVREGGYIICLLICLFGLKTSISRLRYLSVLMIVQVFLILTLRPIKKSLIGVTRPTLVTLPTLDIFYSFSHTHTQKKGGKRRRLKLKKLKKMKKKKWFLFHFLSLFTSKTSDLGAFKKFKKI